MYALYNQYGGEDDPKFDAIVKVLQEKNKNEIEGKKKEKE